MMERLPTASAFERRTVLSLPERLAESKGPVVVYASLTVFALLIGVCCGVVAPLVCLWFGSAPWSLLGIFLFAFMVSTTALLSFAGVGVWRNKRVLELSALEDRLHEGTSKNVWADLESVIDGNLKLKRYDVAEFYSQRMLELSHGEKSLKDVLVSTECWASSPTYQKSVRYWLIWLFEARGILSLSSSRLHFTSRRICFNISLGDIDKIVLKSHPKWLKPIPMNYLVLTFWAEGSKQELYLSPSFSQADTVFQVNSRVRDWYGKIARAKERYEKRVWAPDAKAAITQNEIDQAEVAQIGEGHSDPALSQTDQSASAPVAGDQSASDQHPLEP